MFLFFAILSVLAWVLFKNKKSLFRLSVLLILLLAYLFSNKALFYFVAKAWEFPLSNLHTLPHYHYGVVLGGYSNYDYSTKRFMLNPSGDRLFQACLLLQAGKIDTLIISGGFGNLKHGDYVESTLSKQYLGYMHIDTARIICEDRSTSTYQNIVFTKQVLFSRHYTDTALLISSGFHLRRAMATGYKQGLKAKALSCDILARPANYNFSFFFVPESYVWHYWEVFFHEWIGCVYYKFKAYA